MECMAAGKCCKAVIDGVTYIGVTMLSWCTWWLIFHENCTAVQCVAPSVPTQAARLPDLLGVFCCESPSYASFCMEVSMILGPGMLLLLTRGRSVKAKR